MTLALGDTAISGARLVTAVPRGRVTVIFAPLITPGTPFMEKAVTAFPPLLVSVFTSCSQALISAMIATAAKTVCIPVFFIICSFIHDSLFFDHKNKHGNKGVPGDLFCSICRAKYAAFLVLTGKQGVFI
jgi:hypothetical protein